MHVDHPHRLSMVRWQPRIPPPPLPIINTLPTYPLLPRRFVYDGERKLLNGSIKLLIGLVSNSSDVHIFCNSIYLISPLSPLPPSYLSPPSSPIEYLSTDLSREIVSISTFYLDKYLSKHYVDEEVRSVYLIWSYLVHFCSEPFRYSSPPLLSPPYSTLPLHLHNTAALPTCCHGIYIPSH